MPNIEKLFFLASLFFVCPAAAQEAIGWTVLADVTFTREYNAEFGVEKLTPTFGPRVRAFDGQEILIKGYIIPGRISEGIYFLSRFPNYACFFCGQAGPETVLELRLKPGPGGKRPHFAMDDDLTFRGRLRLNAGDVNHFNYILEDAEVMEGRGGDR